MARGSEERWSDVLVLGCDPVALLHPGVQVPRPELPAANLGRRNDRVLHRRQQEGGDDGDVDV